MKSTADQHRGHSRPGTSTDSAQARQRGGSSASTAAPNHPAGDRTRDSMGQYARRPPPSVKAIEHFAVILTASGRPAFKRRAAARRRRAAGAAARGRGLVRLIAGDIAA